MKPFGGIMILMNWGPVTWTLFGLPPTRDKLTSKR